MWVFQDHNLGLGERASGVIDPCSRDSRKPGLRRAATEMGSVWIPRERGLANKVASWVGSGLSRCGHCWQPRSAALREN